MVSPIHDSQVVDARHAVAARVITVSDRSAAGVRDDLSGAAARRLLEIAGYDVTTVIVSDGADVVEAALRDALASGARLVITSGGTGVGPRDRTPEGTRRVVERELPGVAHLLLMRGLQVSPHAALSRGIVGVSGRSVVANLPGKPSAVTESLEVLVPLLRHLLDQLDGGDH
ncbi:MAG: MogA/MoaB family molybdenum cofactor biosynthesis protein [Propionibacterium sp.]|nr:MogA/MoaB family molybdenum cofactor biosynthesis protein [Propionibacterium sp.]